MAGNMTTAKAADSQHDEKIKEKREDSNNETEIKSSPLTNITIDSGIELGSKQDMQEHLAEKPEVNGQINGHLKSAVRDISPAVHETIPAVNGLKSQHRSKAEIDSASAQNIKPELKPILKVDDEFGQETGQATKQNNNEAEPTKNSDMESITKPEPKENGKLNRKKAIKPAEQDTTKVDPSVENFTSSKSKLSSTNALSKTNTAQPPASRAHLGRIGRNGKIWPGWVELVSEPAYFNAILNKIGVVGLRTQDVWSLENEMLAFLPRPTHAIIFLFRYQESNGDDLNEEVPGDIWFARQTADNACASYALVNIVNNIPGIEMGPTLQQFKQDTLHMTPQARGQKLAGFDFVRHVHNSFASINDVKSVDQDLSEAIAKAKKQEIASKAREAREKRQAATKSLPSAEPTRSSGRLAKQANTGEKRKSPGDEDTNRVSKKAKTGELPAKNNKRKAQDDTSTEQATKKTKVNPREVRNKERDRRATRYRRMRMGSTTFHFCAYMPIGGNVYKLDGLEERPQNIGKFQNEQGDGDWIRVAIPELQARMLQYEEDAIEFNILAVGHNTILTHKDNLVFNVKFIQVIHAKLDKLVEDWREMLDGDDGKLIDGINAEFSITQVDLDAIELTKSDYRQLDAAQDLTELLELRNRVARYQAEYRSSLQEEQLKIEKEQRTAYHGRHDYTEFARAWIEELAQADVLDWLVNTQHE